MWWKRTWIVSAVGLLAFALAATAFAKSKYGCWYTMPNYKNGSLVYITVDRGHFSDFVTLLKTQAEAHDMWFGVDKYRADPRMTPHNSYSMQAFSCAANVMAQNINDEDEYVLTVTASPKPSRNAEFLRARRDLFVALASRFKLRTKSRYASK